MHSPPSGLQSDATDALYSVVSKAAAMRTGLLGAVALLALGSCLHVCRAQNSTTKTLYQYLTALEQNQTFYYEPVDPAYYASINNNTIIEYNGTFYEDLNGTFYELQRQANGSFFIPANATGIAEGLNPDGEFVRKSLHKVESPCDQP